MEMIFDRLARFAARTTRWVLTLPAPRTAMSGDLVGQDADIVRAVGAVVIDAATAKRCWRTRDVAHDAILRLGSPLGRHVAYGVAYAFERWRTSDQRLYGWHRATGLIVAFVLLPIALAGRT